MSPVGKKFRIYFNQTILFDITVNTSVQQPFINNVTLNLTAGNLTLSMRGYGTTPDGYGVLVYSVNLQ
jgi:hypothetical protein